MGKVRIIEQGYSAEERTKAIDNETKESISRKYELEDELKLLRQAVVRLATALNIDLGEEFNNYNNLVESVVTPNKVKKANLKVTSIKIKQKGAKK
jgi:hypothetical protein